MASAGDILAKAEIIRMKALTNQNGVEYAAAIDTLGLNPTDMPLYQRGKADEHYNSAIMRMRPRDFTPKEKKPNLFSAPISDKPVNQPPMFSYQAKDIGYVPTTVAGFKNDIRSLAKRKGIRPPRGWNKFGKQEIDELRKIFFRMRNAKKT